MVLLPGIRGCRTEMDPLAACLSGREVRVLDLPDAPLRTLAAVAAALEPRLPREPFVLVGASFGGLVGWALPPGRLAALVTIGTLPGPSPAQARCRWLAPVVARLPGRAYRALYGARARADWQEDDPDPERWATLPLPSPAVLAARLAAIGAWGLPARPPAPATWVWGATDRHVRWTHADVTDIGATPVIVPGGHRPHLSHPSEVARSVPR